MKIAIIRNDGIGDLVLFNYFLSNLKFKESDEIDFFISCNSEILNYFPIEDARVRCFKFKRPARYNLIKQFNFWLQVFKINFSNYDIVIVPVWSKGEYLARYIKRIRVRNLILFKDDNLNAQISLKNRSIRIKEFETIYYSEFEKNKEFILFFKQLFNLVDKKKSEFKVIEEYIIISPYASESSRIWNLKNWSEIIEFLYALNLKICVFGLEKEIIEFKKKNLALLEIPIIFISSSIELLTKINQCRLFIGMDSGPGHIALLKGAKCLIISNGNHFGRFFPYGFNYENSKNENLDILLPMEMLNLPIKDKIELTRKMSPFRISDIQSKSVIENLKIRLGV
jgi:ADP-heptose:LPS heptosyltransferase